MFVYFMISRWLPPFQALHPCSEAIAKGSFTQVTWENTENVQHSLDKPCLAFHLPGLFHASLYHLVIEGGGHCREKIIVLLRKEQRVEVELGKPSSKINVVS